MASIQAKWMCPDCNLLQKYDSQCFRCFRLHPDSESKAGKIITARRLPGLDQSIIYNAIQINQHELVVATGSTKGSGPGIWKYNRLSREWSSFHSCKKQDNGRGFPKSHQLYERFHIRLSPSYSFDTALRTVIGYIRESAPKSFMFIQDMLDLVVSYFVDRPELLLFHRDTVFELKAEEKLSLKRDIHYRIDEDICLIATVDDDDFHIISKKVPELKSPTISKNDDQGRAIAVDHIMYRASTNRVRTLKGIRSVRNLTPRHLLYVRKRKLLLMLARYGSGDGGPVNSIWSYLFDAAKWKKLDIDFPLQLHSIGCAVSLDENYLMMIGSVRREGGGRKETSDINGNNTFYKKVFVLKLGEMIWVQTDIELALDQDLKHGQALIMPNNAVHIIADGRKNLPCWEAKETADGMIHYGFNFKDVLPSKK